MSRESITGVPRNHRDARGQTSVFALWVVEGLCSGVTMAIVVRRVVGIVSRPIHLRLIQIRSGEKWLLIVALVVLSVWSIHPAFVHLHVMELRT